MFKRFWQTAIVISGGGLSFAWWRFLAVDDIGVFTGVSIALIGIGMLLLAAAREY